MPSAGGEPELSGNWSLVTELSGTSTVAEIRGGGGNGTPWETLRDLEGALAGEGPCNLNF